MVSKLLKATADSRICERAALSSLALNRDHPDVQVYDRSTNS
jgi:hypothetical protein